MQLTIGLLFWIIAGILFFLAGIGYSPKPPMSLGWFGALAVVLAVIFG